nr:hypothetical protein Iba_chr11bCG15430 [Ipomoea batatas]
MYMLRDIVECFGRQWFQEDGPGQLYADLPTRGSQKQVKHQPAPGRQSLYQGTKL